jgi:hypothetical protein
MRLQGLLGGYICLLFTLYIYIYIFLVDSVSQPNNEQSDINVISLYYCIHRCFTNDFKTCLLFAPFQLQQFQISFIFWYIILRSPRISTDISEGYIASIFRVE